MDAWGHMQASHAPVWLLTWEKAEAPLLLRHQRQMLASASAFSSCSACAASAELLAAMRGARRGCMAGTCMVLGAPLQQQAGASGQDCADMPWLISTSLALQAVLRRLWVQQA